MVSSATIDRLVRSHAGNPEAVVDALVAAANDAGGKDNVTVVYAEALRLRGSGAAARGARGRGRDRWRFPENRLRSRKRRRATPGRPGAVTARRPSHVVRFAGRIVRSRTTWFSVGALAGVVGALLLAWRIGTAGGTEPDARRRGRRRRRGFAPDRRGDGGGAPGRRRSPRARRLRGAGDPARRRQSRGARCPEP